MYGYIYKTTNLINGKIYVGQKKSDVFLKEEYLGSGRYLNNAINKYGRENFKVQLIEWCETFEIINEREKYWISYFNCRDSKIGYNIAEGGEGGDTWNNHTEEDKKIIGKKLSDNMKDRCWVNKDNKNKLIKKSELVNYLNDGYIEGKLPYDNDKKLEISNKLKATFSNIVWITDGNKNIRFNKLTDNITNYPGFYEGFTSKAKSKEEQLIVQQKHKQKVIEEFFKTNHFCEKCGKLITEYIGKGRFCSKSCAASHEHTQETKNKISDMNKNGICGMKGKNLSEETKKKHSQTIKEYYQNHKFIWMNNGVKSKKVFEDEIEYYLQNNWKKGRLKTNKPAWNKGLTKETDERVQKNSNNRISTMLEKYGTLNVYEIKKEDAI